MKWRWVVLLALAGCRIGDLVQTPPASGQLQFSVQPSRADSGELIVPPVQVTVLNETRQTDTTYPHAVSVALIQKSGGAALSGTTIAVVVRGVATFANLRLDRPGTGYVLRASASALPTAMSAAFDVTREPTGPSATRLAFTAQPTATPAGTAITPSVRVAARDAAGNVITSYVGIVTVKLGAGAASGALSGTTSVAASSGVATFATLQIDSVGTGYTLTATAGGLTSATSSAFTVTAPPATQLVFTVQPSNTRVDRRIEPYPQVLVLDAAGRPVTSFKGGLTIDLAPNVLGGRVTGAVTVNAVAGVATFSNLRVDRVGVGHRLRVAFAGQAPIAQSETFIVTP